MIPDNKKVVVVGGGTIFHVRPHLAISAPAYGTTARKLYSLAQEHEQGDRFDHELHLTRMADPMGKSTIETNEDLAELARGIVLDPNLKILFWNPAVCDWEGRANVFDICDTPGGDLSYCHDSNEEQGKYGVRLQTREFKRLSEKSKLNEANHISARIEMTPAPKIVTTLRKGRKDFTLVAFKTTSGATEDQMYEAGLALMKEASANLVLANDVKTRMNMIITPEEARYHVTSDRDEALKNLVDMAYLRSHLTFTRSTVVAAEPVPWQSDEVPETLRAVVDHCVQANAYKPFKGKTVGHFACRVPGTTDEFLTSIRKSNFNELDRVGLVRVKSDGPDTVLAYGAKPSVGGQSQRIIFDDHEGFDCIAHFHCPLKESPADNIPVASQREYECGSHECGRNTSHNLGEFEVNGTRIKAVMLDQHGPNIVFSREANPQDVIEFIERNFDLSDKTGGKFFSEGGERQEAP